MSHYFSGSRNFTIKNSTFNTHQASPHDGFDRLQEYVAHGAFHDSGERFDPPKCYPNTRVAIIRRITDWVNGLDEDTRGALVMWLHGAAGAGKSAIAQTIAENLYGQQLILASFFFSRHDPQRGAAKLLVTTLAYQLAVKLPQPFRRRVTLVFEQDPLIITRSMDAQFKALIREPLLELVHSGYSTNCPLVVIIDGLDECEDPKIQSRIVELSFSLLRNRDIPLKILIASRPEFQLGSSFGSQPSSMLVRVALYDDYQSTEDIRHFLAHTFDEIKTRHPLHAYIPENWPPDDSISLILQRSSGQFIFVSTVVKYVASPRHRPTRRLEVILGISLPKAGDSPFAELDALYRHILLGVEDVELIMKIIFFVLLGPENATSVPFIQALFLLEAGDIELLMQNLGSLITLEENYCTFSFAEAAHIRILHASLKDYLFDYSRSKNLFLDPQKMHAKITELCISHITAGNVHRDIIRCYFHHCPLSESNPQLLASVLDLSLNRYCAAHPWGHSSYFVGQYFKYLDSLRLQWNDSEVSQFVADQVAALEQIIQTQLISCPQDGKCFLLASMLFDARDDPFFGYIPGSHHIDLLSMGRYVATTMTIALLGARLNYLTFCFPVLGTLILNGLQKLTYVLDGVPSIHSIGATFALRYIKTQFPYHVRRTPTSFGYRRTRTHSIGQQPRWYRQSCSPSVKMYYRSSAFRSFIEPVTQRRHYIDVAFHYDRPQMLLDEALFNAFGWVMLITPVLLDKSAHSEELFASARCARTKRNTHFYSLLTMDFQDDRRSVQKAVKTYLRRV